MTPVWNQPLPSSTIHFDIESIVWLKVRDMTRPLNKNYLQMPKRVDVTVIAVIINIGAGEKAEDIKKEMDELREVVEKHNQKWNHSPPVVFTLGTIRHSLPPNKANYSSDYSIPLSISQKSCVDD